MVCSSQRLHFQLLLTQNMQLGVRYPNHCFVKPPPSEGKNNNGRSTGTVLLALLVLLLIACYCTVSILSVACSCAHGPHHAIFWGDGAKLTLYRADRRSPEPPAPEASIPSNAAARFEVQYYHKMRRQRARGGQEC